jgi:hypothetical protein
MRAGLVLEGFPPHSEPNRVGNGVLLRFRPSITCCLQLKLHVNARCGVEVYS